MPLYLRLYITKPVMLKNHVLKTFSCFIFTQTVDDIHNNILFSSTRVLTQNNTLCRRMCFVAGNPGMKFIIISSLADG